MIRVVVFLLSVFYFSTGFANEMACIDLFQKSMAMPQPFTEQRSIVEPADLRLAGHLIEPSGQGLAEVTSLLSSRDGTYPVLIDTNKNVIIDHRLPNPSIGPNQPYLGTHRGLYNRLYEITGHRPQIVFAGQIRVVGGKALNLIDQAGTYYQGIEHFKSYGDQAMNQLILANQARLDYASAYFLELGLITSQTQIINFRQQFRNYGISALNEGHTSARVAAEFERRCRSSSACFESAQKVDKYLRWMMEQGGEAFLIANLTQFLSRDRIRAGEFIQWWGLLLKEGTYDVMAGADVLVNPKAERGRQFQQFIIDLPLFLGELP